MAKAPKTSTRAKQAKSRNTAKSSAKVAAAAKTATSAKLSKASGAKQVTGAVAPKVTLPPRTEPVGLEGTSNMPSVLPPLDVTSAVPVHMRPDAKYFYNYTGVLSASIAVTGGEAYGDMSEALADRAFLFPTISVTCSPMKIGENSDGDIEVTQLVFVFNDSDQGQTDLREVHGGTWRIYAGEPIERMRVVQELLLQPLEKAGVSVSGYADGDEMSVTHCSVYSTINRRD